MSVNLTPCGESVMARGELYEPPTKHRKERHYPEAKLALDAFGSDPVALANLLAEHDTLALSLTFDGPLHLNLLCGQAILAQMPLPEPEYWCGMGATQAARKLGVL